ncbi:MAG: hypothetical protein MI974_18475 [Chitinophagales bacterium]|nr:hypothetical protein [Chitinophagales bacterium]
MENIMLSNYMKLFESLSIDSKLALLAAMTENVRKTLKKGDEKNKVKLLHELAGSWSDVDDDALIKDIYENRTLSDRAINFND